MLLPLLILLLVRLFILLTITTFSPKKLELGLNLVSSYFRFSCPFSLFTNHSEPIAGLVVRAVQPHAIHARLHQFFDFVKRHVSGQRDHDPNFPIGPTISKQSRRVALHQPKAFRQREI